MLHLPWSTASALGAKSKTVEDASDDTDVLDVLEGLDLDNLFVDVNEDTSRQPHTTKTLLVAWVSVCVLAFPAISILDLPH